MKRERAIGLFVLILIIGIASVRFFSDRYNAMVEMDENVKAKWSNVETQYQRRFDLIPTLLNTVKAFAAHEEDVFLGVTEARSKATNVQIDPANLNQEDLQRFNEAQIGVNAALSRLLLTVERYPDIKSNQNFLDLQRQLQGTEDMIVNERQQFNLSVQAYNTLIRKFPNYLIAGLFNFYEKPMFKAQQEASNPALIDF